VSRVAITDGIITLAEAKESLNIATGVTANDSLIEDYVEAATGPIERITGPIIGRTSTFTFDGGGSTVSLPVRWRTLTSVTVDGTVTTAYVADPNSGVITALGRFSPGVQNIVVVVVVGYATSADYPPNVKLMARELVRHWYQQGHQGNRPSFGNEVTDNPSMVFGVPTRRLEELWGSSTALPGFA
jgi:hypothetical protein